jgi:hypothetical protein
MHIHLKVAGARGSKVHFIIGMDASVDGVVDMPTSDALQALYFLNPGTNTLQFVHGNSCGFHV